MAQQLEVLTALAGDRRSGDPTPLAPALPRTCPPFTHTCMHRMSDPTFYEETPRFLCKDGSVRIGEDVVGQQAKLSVAHISLSLHLLRELGRGLSPATCVLFSLTEAFSSQCWPGYNDHRIWLLFGCPYAQSSWALPLILMPKA